MELRKKDNSYLFTKSIHKPQYEIVVVKFICFLTNLPKLPVIEPFCSKALICRKSASGLASEYKQKLNIKFASASEKIQNLSGGNQQKVLIAKLLASKPKVIIMDEPTRGIDVGAKTEVHDILRELCNNGVGVIMISSELPEIVGLCDRVMVMHEGKMVGVIRVSEMGLFPIQKDFAFVCW